MKRKVVKKMRIIVPSIIIMGLLIMIVIVILYKGEFSNFKEKGQDYSNRIETDITYFDQKKELIEEAHIIFNAQREEIKQYQMYVQDKQVDISIPELAGSVDVSIYDGNKKLYSKKYDTVTDEDEIVKLEKKTYQIHVSLQGKGEVFIESK